MCRSDKEESRERMLGNRDGDEQQNFETEIEIEMERQQLETARIDGHGTKHTHTTAQRELN